MPTFRRPATSHQRTATLRQFQQADGFSPPLAPLDPKYSLEQTSRPRALSVREGGTTSAELPRRPRGWTSFFHFRLTKTGRGTSGSPNSTPPPPDKCVQAARPDASHAYLVKPATVAPAPAAPAAATAQLTEGYSPRAKPRAQHQIAADDQDVSPTTRVSRESPASSEANTPSKRAKRSLSMHFSSPPNWISKTGSLRRSKRRSAEESRSRPAGKRYVSGPTVMVPDAAPRETEEPTLRDLFDSSGPRPSSQSGPPSVAYQQKNRKRNTSSPLPQISRLSSFNIDVSDLLHPPSPYPPSLRGLKPPSITALSNSQSSSMPSQSRGVSAEHSSTVGSSDMETRDFTSGDDDDTDFKSDAAFDSFRTISSTRPRNVDTPLESMFDESPPSTAGNGRAKRLSIQEILGHPWDGGDTKIMEEEDEGLSTPVCIRAEQGLGPTGRHHRHHHDSDRQQYNSPPSSPAPSLSSRDFGRLSMDDDDDDDYWMRDDDNRLSNHLSPPSSSVNSKKVNPLLRHALASMASESCEQQGCRRPNAHTPAERPRSNIFDWTETSHLDKLEVGGHSPRPKTVHGKQEIDLRGGRLANRKGPGAAHVRSQSVPVVPEPSDGLKPAPKFGTWGLGTKPASEDWDDDFDFEEGEITTPVGAKDSATSFSMVVPASIQATQPTVRAHSGQIRELSLLVNDLKRLCRHGRDLDILCGPYESKWREAQNIIELASPDEEEEGSCENGTMDPFAKDFDSPVDERFLEEGFDASSLGHLEDPFCTPAEPPDVVKNSVVRERQAPRRRSVFSPEDDIFGGGWPLTDDEAPPSAPPRTPDQAAYGLGNSTMISSVMEAMQQQRSTSDPVNRSSPSKSSQPRLFFDTNSLQELVKKAGQLRDSLSDVVRRAELLTQSPASTPRRDRVARLKDGSPAFTRVFTDPASSPPKRLPKSRSTNSALSRASMDSPRLQVMTVN